MGLIEARDVSQVFHPVPTLSAWARAPWARGRPLAALQQVSLTIEPGELLCVMGSNGAGKTTLLKTLAGLLEPTSGAVRLCGRDIRRAARWAASQIGFASADRPGFYDRLTGRQNLQFFAALHGLPRASARSRIEALLGHCGIRAPDQQYQEYSAGAKQRLLLARALLHDPPILLLDEPTKSLDALQAARLHQFIKHELHGALGKTLVFATHSPEEAQRLAGRIAVLHQGRVRACGTLEQIAPGGDVAAALARLCGP